MDGDRLDRRTAWPVAALCALVLVVVGCSSSSGSDGTDVPDDKTSTEASDPTASTDGSGDEGGTSDELSSDEPADDSADGGGDLEGSWSADAGQLLASNTSNLGDVGDIDCSGDIVLTFGGDGSFSQTGTASCTVEPTTVTAMFNSSGAYSAADGTVTLSGVVNEGAMEAAGFSQPLDGGISDGEATYQVDGDTLTVTFADDSVGTVTQTYTRA